MTANRICHFALGALAATVVGATQAQACQPRYTVQNGDTLFSIAETNLGSMTKWSLLLYSNPSLAGGSLVEVTPGIVLAVPCPEGTAVEAAPLPSTTGPDNAELKLLTGGAYPPFTDRGLPGEGMATELINAAMGLVPSPVTYSVTWEDDWSQHLFPLLDGQTFDMGFPWYRPDCESTPNDERCANFHFTEPLMTVPIMLFVREDNQFQFTEDADVLGKSLCRAKGYFTHDLNRGDRRWLSENLIDFVVGATPKDCLEKVMAGEVDAATMNLFLGANAIIDMGLRDLVVPLERPLSEEGLHVIISKKHWRGTAHLYRINAGLKNLKKDGRYQEIVSRHLELFWSKLQ